MKLALADLKSLAVFLAVAEHRGFSGAQKSLHLSQSAISFHIQSLEKRLGFVVCRRGRQGFELTDRGAIVHEHAKSLLAGVDYFESEMGELRRTVTGNLRIGIADNTVSDQHLAFSGIIHHFLRQNPHARLEVTADNPERLAARIVSGDLHLGILPKTKVMDDLQYRPLYVEEHRIYCSQHHPLYHESGGTLTLERIESYAFVVRPYANLQDLSSFPNAVVKAHASNMEAKAMLILSGHVIGSLPCHYAQQWVNQGQLRVLLPEQVVIESAFCLVSRAGIRPTLIMRSFMQVLIAHFFPHATPQPREDQEP